MERRGGRKGRGGFGAKGVSCEGGALHEKGSEERERREELGHDRKRRRRRRNTEGVGRERWTFGALNEGERGGQGSGCKSILGEQTKTC